MATDAVETALNAVGVAVSETKKSTKTSFKKLHTILSAFGDFLGKHTIVITNIILTALTYGGEELLEFKFFKCPSEQPFAREYTLSYTFGIAATLWLIGIAVYNLTWKLCHGCVCWRNFWKTFCATKETRNCLCCVCRSACDCSCLDACWHPVTKSCFSLSISAFFVKPLIVPFAWCIICLWDGDYLACGFSETPGDQNSADYLQWKKESQMYGYIFLPVCLVVMITIQAIYRCSIPHSYMLHRYISVYKECEENALRENMHTNSGKLAQKVVTSFMKREDLKHEDWEKASVFFVDKSSKVFYSPLHKTVIESLGFQENASTQTNLLDDDGTQANLLAPQLQPLANDA